MALDMKFEFEEVVEKIAKVPKAARLGAVLGMLACVVAGYYFLSYRTSHEQLVGLRGQADELQRKLNKVRVVASNLADFEQEVASLERDLDRALKQLPNRKQFEDLLRDISTAGKKVGVAIHSVERKKEIPHSFYAEVPFSLKLEGSYHDLARFMEQLSNLPRIVNMGAMEISIVSESAVGTILNVRGMATTFRFIEKV